MEPLETEMKPFTQQAYQLMFESCAEKFPIVDTSVQFWYEFIGDIKRVIEENQKNQFQHQQNVETLWRAYSTDLKMALEEHVQKKTCRTPDYMNLYFKVKGFHLNYVSQLPEFQQSVPEFPNWFNPFVMDWLKENEENSMDIVINAYNDDKAQNFPNFFGQKISNSVIDVNTQLNGALRLLKQMAYPNPEVPVDMMQRFSETLNNVLLGYVDMVQKDFPKFAHDEKMACTLMNNVQQLRAQLEQIYQMMGGAELDEQIGTVVIILQKKLNAVLAELVAKRVTLVDDTLPESVTLHLERKWIF